MPSCICILASVSSLESRKDSKNAKAATRLCVWMDSFCFITELLIKGTAGPLYLTPAVHPCQADLLHLSRSDERQDGGRSRRGLLRPEHRLNAQLDVRVRENVLRIRLTEVERSALDAPAPSLRLETSTWARMELLALTKKQVKKKAD